LQHAEQLKYERTLYENSFLEAKNLNPWVVEVWQESKEGMGGTVRQFSKTYGLVIVSFPTQKADSNKNRFGSTNIEYDCTTCLI
jgi:hypothetical protein